MRLKPLLHRVHREFNVSVAELDYQDVWKSALVGIAMISSDTNTTQKSLHSVVAWVEQNWPDVMVEDDKIEIYH